MKILNVFLMLILMVFSAVGADLFEFDAQGNVLFGGKKLIIGENVVEQNKSAALPEAAPEKTTHELPQAKVHNAFSKKDAFAFRRELGVSDNQIELTFQGSVPAFVINENGKSQFYGYNALLDVSDYLGGSYYVITGRPFRPVINQGEFTATSGVHFNGVRFLALKKGEKALALDFNCEGITNYSTSRWTVTSGDGHLKIATGLNSDYRGGIFSGKVVIYSGDEKDNVARHTQQKYGYSEDFPVARAFSFGAKVTGKQYVHADDKTIDDESKYGWAGKINAKKVEFAPSGALYSALQGEGKAVFKVKNLKKGVYYVTYCGSAMHKDSGLFSLQVEDQTMFSDQQIKAGSMLTAAMPLWIEDGTAEVTLDGAWQISTLQFQLLQTSEEDRKFRRGYWLSNDYEPSVMLKNSYFARPPAMQCDLYSVQLAPHRPDYPASYVHKMPKKVLLPESTAKNAWRYNELYISSGNNSSRFTDFITDELKNRELDLISRSGGKIVLVSGLLSRHTFPDHIARADQYLCDFTRLAHQRNMKVLDHVDLTLLWNTEAGFRVMCQTTNALQRNVNTWSVNRSYCLNNPHLNKTFFAWAKNLVKQSNIDGMMVDEVVFFTESFCGCRYCREAFTRDTGLILPMDETHPAMGKSDHLVWKVWLQWRSKSIGDWWVAFRQAIAEVKPDFSMLVYTTHGGFSNRHAGPYFETARGVDILGTEIMSRNVIASARSVNAFRKMKSGLGDFYHAPIYGLVYPGGNCNNIAYFGWALNYMNRQTTWDKCTVLPPGAVDYKNYPARLDHSLSKPISDTAVVYSLPTVIFPAQIRYINEILGLSELLSDQGIMHDFIINAALTDHKTMQRFKTLVLANARCMSDEEIEAVKRFARNGGTVYLSFNCATADELGNPRKVWPFREIFGISPHPSKLAKVSTVKVDKQHKYHVSDLTMVRFNGKVRPDVQVLYRAEIGKSSVPCVLNTTYGQGQIFLCSAALGASVVELECGPGKPYSWNPPPENLALARNVMQLLQPEKPLLKVNASPGKILISLTGNDHADGELLCVNMLNCTRTVEVGQMIPNKMDADRGKVEGNITFTLNVAAGKVAKIYAVSPDFAGEKSLQWQKSASGITVTVPGEMLKTFLEARIQLKK